MTIHSSGIASRWTTPLFERLAKAGIETHPGDTLVLGAANCTLTSLARAQLRDPRRHLDHRSVPHRTERAR
jgi:hypothetical protein